MVVLKKIKGATLIETIVASVLVLAIFVVATLTINNVFYSSVINDSFRFENRFKEVHYQTIQKKVIVPFYEETSNWEISVEKIENNIVIEALLKSNRLAIKKTVKDE